MSFLNSLTILLFAVTVVHAIYKAIDQAKERRKLAERELRWRQSEQARLILDDLEEDEFAAAAMLMLDYDGRVVKVDGRTFEFRWTTIDRALRTSQTGSSNCRGSSSEKEGEELEFTDDEVLIRDCYDHMFYHLERISLWIEVELISVYDVVFPIGYLASCMEEPRREIFEKFLQTYGYSRTITLLRRFKEWGGPLDANSAPPLPRKPTPSERVREFLINVEPPGKLELANAPISMERPLDV